jgi:hypothetical protein
MNHTELLGSHEPSVEVKRGEQGYEVQTPTYSIVFHHDTPYIDLHDTTGERWMQILKASQATTSTDTDVTYEFGTPSYEIAPDGGAIIRIPSINESGGYKEQTWICHPDFIETSVNAELSGDLRSIELLGGTIVAPNLFGQSLSERYFDRVYNPQPSEREQAVMSAAESTHITTSGMWKPGRRREFLMTPFAYGFHQSTGKHSGNNWLMAGISAPIADQNIVEYAYNAREDGFSLTLTYDSVKHSGRHVTSPSLLLHFAPEPLRGLDDFKKHATALGHLPVLPVPKAAGWHRDATFVSWGHQLELERRHRERGVTIPARDFASEAVITQVITTLDNHGVHVGKIVIDDRWQTQYGTNTPDSNKWPDLAKFNRTQHELGRHVLLWVKLFDPEGLPPELCILDAHGRPIASDPTNPTYIDALRSQIHTLLSPQYINADGLKLDFLAQLPHGPGLRWHGTQRGHTALHHLMKHIYDEAKHAKPDSLIEAQVVSPWFADTLDQVRLNDTNERHPVVKTMGSRALLAQTLLPDHSIDPDGWPMRDKKAWLTYIDAQPELAGTVTTHFAESVNGQPLTKKDYHRLARAIQKSKT